jgi:glycosyltransferase involved in cell wall biosynthesis
VTQGVLRPSDMNSDVLQAPGHSRVLHVMRMSAVSGAENHLLELTAALRKYGWRCDVLVPSPSPRALDRFAKRLAKSCERVHVVSMRRDLSPGLVFKLARLLASGRYDVAHAHLVHADWHLAAASLIVSDVPLVSSKHNPDPFRRLSAFRLVERAVLRRYSAIIAISDSLRQFTEASTAARVTTIHYGLGAPAHLPRKRPDRGQATQLLAVGRLEEQKGFDVAIQAMARVVQETPHARLSIAGSGNQQQLLADKVRALHLTDAVSMLGRRDDVDELMLNADILVHPARWEGFGLVLLEAMRSGLPVVATRVGAIPEIVTDGVTGLLVPPGDPDQLAAAILELIRNPARRREMGIAGFERLKGLFTPERMAREVTAVYRAVVKQSGLAAAQRGSR